MLLKEIPKGESILGFSFLFTLRAFELLQIRKEYKKIKLLIF